MLDHIPQLFGELNVLAPPNSTIFDGICVYCSKSCRNSKPPTSANLAVPSNPDRMIAPKSRITEWHVSSGSSKQRFFLKDSISATSNLLQDFSTLNTASVKRFFSTDFKRWTVLNQKYYPGRVGNALYLSATTTNWKHSPHMQMQTKEIISIVCKLVRAERGSGRK